MAAMKPAKAGVKPARGLFGRLPPKKQMHPSFSFLEGAPSNRSTRAMMNEAFARFADRDGNFVQQFQTTGFDNRTFELYVSELLHSEGFAMISEAPHPDFSVEKGGVRIHIECTTANRTDTGGSRLVPYEPTNDRDLDLQAIRERSENDIPVRIGGALRNKLLHRIDKKRDPKAYWELPHVAGQPFVIAVESFHEHGSLGFGGAATAFYLYGIRQSPSWDGSGRLVIEQQQVDRHISGDKDIPSGFFNLEGTEHVSAVLWTNAGTVPKFTRVALAGPYPDEDLTVLRFGTMNDPDPNAHQPLPFAYIVGDPGTPEETWGQEAMLIHNPNALYPVPTGLFETVTETVLENGRPVDTIKSEFLPYMSLSNVFAGPGHRKLAMDFGNQAYESLVQLFAANDPKPG
ncbi:hypothetical protein ACCS81_00970 [Rhizobium ruizarguesonis]|uniref:hypothetical protein n=1 Tax=Rhizobium ruizarguesonis TaxID=2081791 RepID=UPI001FDF8C73|nr:hypothetical protein [Rhizobium ruizarguesonis]